MGPPGGQNRRIEPAWKMQTIFHSCEPSVSTMTWPLATPQTLMGQGFSLTGRGRVRELQGSKTRDRDSKPQFLRLVSSRRGLLDHRGEHVLFQSLVELVPHRGNDILVVLVNGIVEVGRHSIFRQVTEHGGVESIQLPGSVVRPGMVELVLLVSGTRRLGPEGGRVVLENLVPVQTEALSGERYGVVMSSLTWMIRRRRSRSRGISMPSGSWSPK